MVRYDNISSSSWLRLAEQLRASATPVCALLLGHEVEQFREKAGTGWVEIGAVGNARLLAPKPGDATWREDAPP